MSDQTLRLAVDWERVVGDLLERTRKFPKTERYGLGDRIDAAALEVAVQLSDARYSTGARRRRALEEVNLQLHRLRVLVRLAHGRRALATNALEHLTRELDAFGSGAGAWRERVAAEGNVR